MKGNSIHMLIVCNEAQISCDMVMLQVFVDSRLVAGYKNRIINFSDLVGHVRRSTLHS